jgi:hypothetical protein
MKNKIKLKSLILGLTFSLSVQAAETNWTKLIKDMNLIQVETVKIQNTSMNLDVASLPDGKIRLVSVNRLRIPEQVIIQIETKEKDLKTLCEESLVFKNSFKVQLLVSKGTLPQNFSFSLASGEEKKSIQFENPFQIENEKVEILSGSKFPWTYAYELGRYQNGPEAKLVSMIELALRQQTAETVTVDLSEHNGIACDLASGKAQLSLNKSIRHEKGLPDRKSWINKDRFAEVYRGFWRDRIELNSSLTGTDLRSHELVLLGWNLAEMKFDRSIINRSSGRLGFLYNALKENIMGIKDTEKQDLDIINIETSWKKTFEYVIPTEIMMKRDLETFSGSPILVFRG